MKYFYLTLAVFLICGCANPINRYTAGKYYEMGAQAERDGNWKAAREAYRRATLNADWGMLGTGPKAHTLYEYGRISGYLCDQVEAERSLHESLELQDKDREARLQLRPATLFELARLYYDTDRKVDAVPSYEEVIQLVRRLDIKAKDPIRFAITLEEYADCLRMAERVEDAEVIEEEAQSIRDLYTDPEIEMPFQRFSVQCS